MIVSITVLAALGQTINVMTLGGLAIAIGELVDDAVVDVENIFRRLRENAAAAMPQPALQVVIAAALEVRSSVVYATFIVALVFVPLLTFGGIGGKLFSPLGLAYILAIMTSLVVAMTLTLAVFAITLPRRMPHHHRPLD